MAQLTDRVRAFLEEPRFAVIATLRPDGALHQSVVWYQLQEESRIVFSTAIGNHKYRNLARDPRLSVCVEDGYRYVALEGMVTFIDDPETVQAETRAIAVHYVGPEKAPEMTAAILATPHVMVHMKVERVLSFGFADRTGGTVA